MKFLFFLLATALFGGEGILFYFHDAGETYGLLPVVEKLREQEIKVDILADGTAATILREYTSVSEADSFDPALFVTGVAFPLQGELLEAFKKRGVPTIAFWDNFNAEGEAPYFKTAHEVEKKADTLWVPSELVGKGFPSRPLFVSGHPSLENWVAEAATVDRATVCQKLQLDPSKKYMVFVGGYGKEYEEAFELLLKLDLDVLIQPHPKYGGSVEEKYHPNLRILKNEISTIEAIVLADVVLCHQSTVGFQALFLQKPVIHLIPPGQQFTTVPIELGLAKKVYDRHTLHQALEWAKNKPPADYYSLLGIPQESAKRCVAEIHENIESNGNGSGNANVHS